MKCQKGETRKILCGTNNLLSARTRALRQKVYDLSPSRLVTKSI